MKKNLQILTIGLISLLILVGIIVFLHIGQNPSFNGINPGNEGVKGGFSNTFHPSHFNYNKEKPYVTNPLYTYKITTKTGSQEDIHKLAQKFDADGNILESHPPNSSIIIYNIIGPTDFTTNNRDSILWENETDEDRDHDPRLLPTDENARIIADNFIKSHGLAFPGAIQKNISHGQRTQCDLKSNICKIISESSDKPPDKPQKLYYSS